VHRAWLPLVLLASLVLLGAASYRAFGPMGAVAVLPISYAVFAFVVAPIVVHASNRTPWPTPWALHDGQTAISPAAEEAVRAQHDRLAPLGFAWAGTVVARQPAMSTVQALFTNADAGEVCVVQVATTAVAPEAVALRSVRFLTRLADARILHTSDATRVPFVWTNPPAYVAESFPEVANVEALHALHRRRAAQMAIAATPLTEGFDPVAFVTHAESVGAEHAEREGYFRLDRQSGARVVTWKGAFLGTWGLALPIGAMRAWRRKRAARAITRALGVDPTGPSSRG
jgi:hypothetical protein